MEPVSEFKSKSGMKRIMSAFFYSVEGLQEAWRIEHAFRQELILVIVAAIVSNCSRMTRAAVTSTPAT